MPQFYFHLGPDLLQDEVGKPLPDVEAARAHGCKIAKELALHGLQEVCVTVTDKFNRKLFELLGAD
jgi:hypothetical protein